MLKNAFHLKIFSRFRDICESFCANFDSKDVLYLCPFCEDGVSSVSSPRMTGMDAATVERAKRNTKGAIS